MVQDFDPIEEVRKHPGVAAGVVFVLAGIGLATLLMSQRTGPRRYEVFRERLGERLDPRGWVDASSLKGRFSDLAHSLRASVSEGVDGLGSRASSLGELAQERVNRFSDEARGLGRHLKRKGGKDSQRQFRRYKKQARRYAEDAGDFARDHAREGGTILAVAVLAAALGAVVWENQKKGGGLFD